MERTHATVSGAGLQISLLQLQQYGIEQGARVTIEFGPNKILVTMPISEPKEAENLVLRLALRYLGDAVQVKALRDTSAFNRDGWRVEIYRADLDLPVGHLVFTQFGELLPEFSTRFELMRR